MKLLKKLLFIITIFLTALFFTGCRRPNNQYSVEFDEFMEEIFLGNLQDPLNVNFLIKDTAKFGLSDLEVESIDLSREAYDNYMSYLHNSISVLENFDKKTLSDEQLLTYEIVLDNLKTSYEFKDYYLYELQLGSYLGYNAQLPIILSEYHFYTKKDIENYFLYLRATRESFHSIINFENLKKENGFSMNDYILDGIIEQCDKFVNQEENYLIPLFNEKINKLTFLTEQEKATYIALNKQYIDSDFIPSYKYLRDEMKKLKGKAMNNMGIYHFPGNHGQEYYRVLFKRATGTNMSVEDGYRYLANKVDEEIFKLSNIIMKDETIFDKIISPNLVESMTYQETLDFFLNNYQKDFLKIDDVDIRVENIHPSLEENSSPAMYFLSPIDANVTEVIYVNNTMFTENPTYAFMTLSHEGIPGHLLQHVTLKNSDLPNIRKTTDYNSYSEGWATYVEEYIAKYLDIDADVMEAYYINNRLNYVIMCIADIGINFYGWDQAEFKEFLVNYYGAEITDDEVLEMYNQLIEVPTNFLEYYFSYYQIIDLKAEFINQAKKYNIKNVDYEFHKFYLEMGPAPFYIIEEQIDDYLENAKS